jgi:hypothetical protein
MSAHKGTIEAQNHTNAQGEMKGARFIVTLPRQTNGGGPNEPKHATKRSVWRQFKP